MNIVKIEIGSMEDVKERALNAIKQGKPVEHSTITFTSQDLLWRTLSPLRMEILKTLCGAGEISIRETARRVGRDVKAVHGDCTALINAGILERTKTGGVHFPYDAIKVEFMIKAA